MKRMAEVTNVTVVSREFQDPAPRRGPRRALSTAGEVPPGVEVYEINGPFFFGAAEKFKDTLAEVSKKPKVLDHPDAQRARRSTPPPCTHSRDLVRRTRRDGTLVLFSDVHAQPLLALGRSGLLDEIGEDHFFGDIDEALARARAPPWIAGRGSTSHLQ